MNKDKKNVCIGLLAHVDAGKTTLSEALLYQAGVLKNPGRVDKGDAYLDTYAMEKERGITIFSKQAVFSWEDMQVTLLDTPGHIDFSAEMERTLQVLDYAVLVISGPDGVQGHTQTLWKLLEKYQIPVFIFVNKMDQPGTEKEFILGELQAKLNSSVTDFSDLQSEEFYEQVSLCEEEMLNQYLEQGEVEVSQIAEKISERKIFPCVFGSALRMEGVKHLLEVMQTLLLEPSYDEVFGAKVFKIMRDDKGARLTYVKVTGGQLKPRMELSDKKGEWTEKINQIRVYSGSRFETVAQAVPGMICALTGLTKTYPGEGLGAEFDSGAPVLEPVLTYRILFQDGEEPAKMLPKLREIEEEEPALHIVWNEELQEIHAQVMGEVQIEIIKRWILERYGVSVTFGTGNIVYKETICEPVEGVGHYEPLRHYAEVHLWMEPLAVGSGVQISTDCSEDKLDKNWQRLILTHLAEKEHKGVLTGAGLTDVKLTLIAGRAHNKHTEGGDFREATYRAVRQGLMQTKSVLLEPYYEYRLIVPETSIGRAMTDIERMAGSFTLQQNLPQTNGEGAQPMAVLTGEAPVSTMRDYTQEVTAYTKGHGQLFCSLLGYRPCHNADEVIAAKQYDADHDVKNPSGSVFCAHGAGFFVPWNQVFDYMHIDTSKRANRDSSEMENDVTEKKETKKQEEEWLDVSEIDSILERSSFANRKQGGVSHKGISAKRVSSVKEKPVGLSKPRKKQMPDVNYLLVDGYNIIFAWEELKMLAQSDIAAARGKLMDILCNYQGFHKCELILVFDAYRVANHKTEVLDYHNIHVVYTKEAETADQYIEKFAHENGKKYRITVATSDGLEQIIIRGAGCRLLSARDFEADVKRSEQAIREILKEQ